jgi:hypothetical protein
MMSLALVVTSQSETGLSDTLKTMRNNREKMQKYLGHIPSSVTTNSSSSSNNRKQSNARSSISSVPTTQHDSSPVAPPSVSRRKSSARLSIPNDNDDDDNEPNGVSDSASIRKSTLSRKGSVRKSSRDLMMEEEEE